MLSLEEGFVVLAVTALHDLADVHDSAVMTVPTSTFAARDLIRGVTATPKAPHSLLLDGPAMLAHTELRALAATNTDLLHNSGSTTTQDTGLAALVPIYCLAAALGRRTSATDPNSCVLLIEHNDRHVGFAVSGLFNIAPLTWRDTAAPDPQVADDAVRAVRDSPLIEVQGVPGLIPQLDLRALAAVVCGPAGVSESADLQRTAS